MNYKIKFYDKYVSSHTHKLYGDISLDLIRREFPVWNSYFGIFLPLDKNSEILDIGCGNGSLIYWLHQQGFEKAAGVDLSDEQIRKAAHLGIKNIIKSDFKYFLGEKENFYDVVFARDVLEHFTKEEILDILISVRRALKIGGVFIAQTVNAENLLWGRLRHADFTHDIAFTKESARQTLLISGFSDVQIYPQRPVAHGLKSFIRYVLWRCFEYFLHFYLLVETGSSGGIFTQNIIIFAKK